MTTKLAKLNQTYGVNQFYETAPRSMTSQINTRAKISQCSMKKKSLYTCKGVCVPLFENHRPTYYVIFLIDFNDSHGFNKIVQFPYLALVNRKWTHQSQLTIINISAIRWTCSANPLLPYNQRGLKCVHRKTAFRQSRMLLSISTQSWNTGLYM